MIAQPGLSNPSEHLGHWVIAARMEGMAAANALDAEPTAAQGTVVGDRI